MKYIVVYKGLKPIGTMELNKKNLDGAIKLCEKNKGKCLVLITK